MKAKRTTYIKKDGLELSLGNLKLPDNTLIFNMGSATDCPSFALGMCKVVCPKTGENACYAKDPEVQYPDVKPYRDRQQAYWLNHTGYQIAVTLVDVLTTRKRKDKKTGKLTEMFNHVKYFRFNEAGDFWSQDCVDKLDIIAKVLKQLGITTYGYTARTDLDFTDVAFLVKGSGHDNSNNGVCIAHPMTEDEAKALRFKTITIDGIDFKVCPEDCSICGMCKKDNGLNIAIPMH